MTKIVSLPFAANVEQLIGQYMEQLEQVKLKDGLKTAMKISQLGKCVAFHQQICLCHVFFIFWSLPFESLSDLPNSSPPTANQYLQESQFWVAFKQDKARCATVIHVAIQVIYLLATLLQPYMPSFTRKLAAQLGVPLEGHFNLQFDKFQYWLPEGHKLGEAKPLFRKIEDSEVREREGVCVGQRELEGDEETEYVHEEKAVMHSTMWVR